MENQQTNFPTQPPLVATSKQPPLGPAWTVGRLCLPLPAPPYLRPLTSGSFKSQGAHLGQACPVLLD